MVRVDPAQPVSLRNPASLTDQPIPPVSSFVACDSPLADRSIVRRDFVSHRKGIRSHPRSTPALPSKATKHNTWEQTNQGKCCKLGQLAAQDGRNPRLRLDFRFHYIRALM